MRKIQSAPNLVEQVYAILRDSICNGALEPGLHLVQEDLAERLNVSRHPIQQAMLLLKADGLVIESGNRGLYVAPMEPENIVHHYQIRLQLDSLAASLLIARLANQDEGIAERLQKRGSELIRQGIAAQESADAAAAVRLDMEFHSLIYECSGNPLIANAAEPHWNFLRRVMTSILLHADRGETVWKEHGLILQQFLTGQAQAVQETVASHILGAQEALIKAIQARKMHAIPTGGKARSRRNGLGPS